MHPNGRCLLGAGAGNAKTDYLSINGDQKWKRKKKSAKFAVLFIPVIVGLLYSTSAIIVGKQGRSKYAKSFGIWAKSGGKKMPIKVNPSERRKIVPVRMQKKLVEKINAIVENSHRSLSKFCRDAVDKFLNFYNWDELAGDMLNTTLYLEKASIEKIDELIKNGVFVSRSEFYRLALMMKIKECEEAEKRKIEMKEGKKLPPIVQKKDGIELISIPLDETSLAVYKTYKIIPKEEF